MSAMLYWSAARYLCPFLRCSSMTPYSLQDNIPCQRRFRRSKDPLQRLVITDLRLLQGTTPAM